VTQIGFYHLTRSGVEQALPALLGRTLAAGERGVVRVGSEERLRALDAALWLSREPDWLPHGTPLTGEADLQPIWLCTDDPGPAGAPNGARFLFLIDGTTSALLDAFTRVFDLFDGADPAAVEAARARWTAAKAAGHSLAYWQQTPRGWERKQ
jgi:DNA polymerase-3 subunit chi